MQSKNSEDFARVNVGSMTSLTTTKQESAASDEIFGMDFSMEMMSMYSSDLAYLHSKSDKESESLVGLGETSSKPNQNGEHWFEEMMSMYSIGSAFLNSKSDKESESLVGLGETSSKPNQNGEHWFDLEHTVESKSKTGKVGKPKYYQ